MKRFRLLALMLVFGLVLSALPARAFQPPATLAPPGMEPGRAHSTRIIKIPAPEGAFRFGEAVAYDGKTLVVGAPFSTVNGVYQQGAVYIYAVDSDDPAGWQLEATITLPELKESGWLGEAVAVEGDVVVIGIPRATVPGAPQNGAVLFVERSAEDLEWRITQYETNVLELPDGDVQSQGSFANFGRVIAIEDGLVLIGAPAANIVDPELGPLVRRGQVYLFARQNGQPGTWGNRGSLRDVNGVMNDDFGRAVAIETHEGVTHIVVGAPAADVTEELFDNQGKAILFRRASDQGGFGALSPILAPGQPQNHTQFGRAVALDDFDMFVSGYSRTHSGIPGAGEVLWQNLNGNGAGMLQPDDPEPYSFFGVEMAATDGILAVGAPNASFYDFARWGAIYRFERGQAGWEQVAKYAPTGIDEGGVLGSAVAVHSGLVVGGAPEASGLNGAVYIFDDRPLPEQTEHEQPDDEQPDDEKPDGEDPDDEKPHEEDPDGTVYRVFLAATSYDITATIPAPAPLPADPLPDIQILKNSDSIQSNAGARLGAVADTLHAPLPSYIINVSAPITMPHPELTLLGSFHHIGALTTTVAPPDKSFLVGLPVPAGTDTSNLGAAVMLPAGGLHHAEDDAPRWVMVPGGYDSRTGLFGFTLSRLYEEGVLAVLVSHPNLLMMERPAEVAQTGVQLADNRPMEFMVQCAIGVPRNSPLCDLALREQVGEQFLAAYDEFRSFGFRDPSLNFDFPWFGAPNAAPELIRLQRFFGIELLQFPCRDAGTYYGDTQSIELCYDPAVGIDEDLIDTIRHELFHAVQFSYPTLRADWNNISWLLEGTAAAVERSGVIMRHSPAYPLRAVEPVLDTGYDPANLLAYQTQDFWVYLGRSLEATLGYLVGIFEIGGRPAQVDAGMGDTLENAYWAWVKNQTFEKEEMLDGRFTFGPCRHEFDAVTPIWAQVSNDTPDVNYNNALPPLSATAYTVIFLDEFNGININVLRGGPETRFKIYKELDNNCVQVPESEAIYLETVEVGDAYFVLVANASHTASEIHRLEVIGGGGQ